MTSQKSLKNNVNANDFKRSFVGSLLFPTIAFLVLFFTMTVPVLQYVTSEDYLKTGTHEEVSMFLSSSSVFYYMFDLVPIGMVICGMLTAFKSFNYLLSKKQVNVFLSLGIKRNTMFVNRFISGIICLFVSVFVPMLLIYVINIANFGLSVHLTELFLYVVSLLFVSGVIGYAVTSAMIMVSGNLFEVALSSVALTFIPYVAIWVAIEWMYAFLNGFVQSSNVTPWLSIFNPWSMAENIHKDFIPYSSDDYMDYGYAESINAGEILGLLNRDTTPDKYKVSEIYQVDLGLTLPIIFWAVVSIVLIGLTFFLYNRRKAEHANSLGKFPISRAVICTIAFEVVAIMLVTSIGNNMSWSVLFIIVALIAGIIYLAIQLVLSRSFKTSFKSLSWYGVLTVVLAVCAVVIGTGIFGTFNKVPDKSEVKSVSIDAREIAILYERVNPNSNVESYINCTTDEGKEAILKAYELLKNEKVEYGEESIDKITLAITDKDGNIKYRTFDIYSEETYVKYLELVYGTEFFDTLLETRILGSVEQSANNFKNFMWAYEDNDMIGNINEELNYIEDVDAFLEALYKDMSAMTFDELFRNSEKPLGILIKKYYDEDYPGYALSYADNVYGPVHDGVYEDYTDYEKEYNYYTIAEHIPVYASMTNTVKFLNDNGYEFPESTLTVKELLYSDVPMPYDKAVEGWMEFNKDSYKGWGTYTNVIEPYDFSNITYASNLFCHNSYNIGFFLEEKVTYDEFLKTVYKDAGHPLTSVTDKAEIEKIMNKTVSNEHLLIGDNGRYVYVIYEEGPVMCYYIPEANVGVVK